MDHDRRVLREQPDRDPLQLASLKPPAGIAGRSLPALRMGGVDGSAQPGFSRVGTGHSDIGRNSVVAKTDVQEHHRDQAGQTELGVDRPSCGSDRCIGSQVSVILRTPEPLPARAPGPKRGAGRLETSAALVLCQHLRRRHREPAHSARRSAKCPRPIPVVFGRGRQETPSPSSRPASPDRKISMPPRYGGFPVRPAVAGSVRLVQEHPLDLPDLRPASFRRRTRHRRQSDARPQ